MPIYPKERFLNLISKGVSERIFCFIGDAFLCEEAAHQVIKQITTDKNVPKEVFSDNEINSSFFEKNTHQGGSLFGTSKVYWIKDASPEKLNRKALADFPHYLILTFSQNPKIPAFLKEISFFVDFTLKPNEKQAWALKMVQTLFQKANKKVTQPVQNLLLELTGYNLAVLKNSIHLLLNYVGEKEIIEEQDVVEIIPPSNGEGIFGIAEKLVTISLEKVLFYVRNLNDQGIHPLLILSILAKEIRCLIEVKEILNKIKLRQLPSYNQFIKGTYSLFKKETSTYLLTLHPYVIYLLCQRAQGYDLDFLKILHKHLLFTERAIKSAPKQAAIYHLERLILFWHQGIKK